MVQVIVIHKHLVVNVGVGGREENRRRIVIILIFSPYFVLKVLIAESVGDLPNSLLVFVVDCLVIILMVSVLLELLSEGHDLLGLVQELRVELVQARAVL